MTSAFSNEGRRTVHASAHLMMSPLRRGSRLAALVVAAALAVAALVTFGEMAPASGQANTPTCLGRTATIVGTAGDDIIKGTAGDDVIVGLTGHDLITGLGGNDIICGGRGWDRIYGQAGSDQLAGGPGNDRLFGGAGAQDFCYGGTQTDRASYCEGRVSVRPFNLLVADDDVIKQSLSGINIFRQQNSDFEVPGVLVPTKPDTLGPLYLSTGHNNLAKTLLDQKISADVSSGSFNTSRTFRFYPSFNALATIQSTCIDLANRETSALPQIISDALVASPDLKLLATNPTADRVGVAWQERNQCLYWVVVFGSGLQ